MSLVVPVVRLDPELPLPSYARLGDAGADLVARADHVLAAAGGRALVPTGIAIAIPDGYAGFVLPRSGLALRQVLGRNKQTAPLVTFGRVTRPENIAMVKLLEIDAEPLMPALVRLRDSSGVLGVSLRSGSLRIYAPDAERLLASWKAHWPFPDIRLLGERWVAPDMEDVFTAYSQRYDSLLKGTK